MKNPIEFCALDGTQFTKDVPPPLPAYYFLTELPALSLTDETDARDVVIPVRRFARRELAHGKRRWFVYQEVAE